MFVKICGTTNLEDALLSIAHGADALGFIFAPSKRRVTVAAAAEITRRLPPHILWVGVFTEPNLDEIAGAVRQAGLAAVQMHWKHNSGCVNALREEFGDGVVLWQVVGFQVDPIDRDEAEREFALELRAALLDSRLDYILLDAVKSGASGGLGRAFSWQQAAAIVKPLLVEIGQLQSERGLKLPRLLLAGGLNAENVQEAIEVLQPWGVDVVSGVEASPGKKSPDRLAAFFASVRGIS